jgi:hypothetical protein
MPSFWPSSSGAENSPTGCDLRFLLSRGPVTGLAKTTGRSRPTDHPSAPADEGRPPLGRQPPAAAKTTGHLRAQFSAYATMPIAVNCTTRKIGSLVRGFRHAWRRAWGPRSYRQVNPGNSWVSLLQVRLALHRQVALPHAGPPGYRPIGRPARHRRAVIAISEPAHLPVRHPPNTFFQPTELTPTSGGHLDR